MNQELPDEREKNDYSDDPEYKILLQKILRGENVRTTVVKEDGDLRNGKIYIWEDQDEDGNFLVSNPYNPEIQVVFNKRKPQIIFEGPLAEYFQRMKEQKKEIEKHEAAEKSKKD